MTATYFLDSSRFSVRRKESQLSILHCFQFPPKQHGIGQKDIFERHEWAQKPRSE